MTIDEHKSTEISVPAITGVEALRIAAVLGFPSVAAGVIARRRSMMGLLEKLQADRSTLSTIRRCETDSVLVQYNSHFQAVDRRWC